MQNRTVARHPSKTRQQYGRDWQYKPHAVLDFRSGAVLGSDTQISDLLLVTAIPWNFEARNRIVIFGGLHGRHNVGATSAAAENSKGRPLRVRVSSILSCRLSCPLSAIADIITFDRDPPACCPVASDPQTTGTTAAAPASWSRPRQICDGLRSCTTPRGQLPGTSALDWPRIRLSPRW